MIEINIDTNNAAFDEDAMGEVTRVLDRFTERILHYGGPGADGIPMKDTNGNKVGMAYDKVTGTREGLEFMQRALTRDLNNSHPTIASGDRTKAYLQGRRDALELALHHIKNTMKEG